MDLRIQACEQGFSLYFRDLPGLNFKAVALADVTGRMLLPAVKPVFEDCKIEYFRGSVTEWYINRAEGVEQGFTISSAADGSATPPNTTTLSLDFGEDLTANITENGQSAVFYLKETGQLAYHYRDIKAWDANGCAVSAKLEVDSGDMPLLCLVLDTTGMSYPITVDPILYGATVKRHASDASINAVFGSSVVIDGDVAVVGASAENSMGSEAGAAYIFERNAGGSNVWGQVKKLTASDATAGDRFGYSVAVDGDVVVVSACTDPGTGGGFEGAVYVFERNAGSSNAWGEVKILTGTWSSPPFHPNFGTSVAIEGDNVIVGSPFADSLAHPTGGLVYIFERNEGGANAWGLLKTLTGLGAVVGDKFGSSVAVANDVLVVGADEDNTIAYENGAVYIFERNAGGSNVWGEVKKLMAFDAGSAARFGSSVAVDGDVVVVGAYSAPSVNGFNFYWYGGQAYVFERNAGGTNAWGETKKLIASDAQEGHRFGRHVAVAGDVVMVTTLYDSARGVNAGAIYKFERNVGGTNAWGERSKVTASDTAVEHRFGSMLSMTDDLVLVGASGEASAGDLAGAAYFIPLFPETKYFRGVAVKTASDAAANDRCGASVALEGDLAVAGSPGDFFGSGAAYVFEQNVGGKRVWGEVKKLTASDTATSDYFGWSISLADDAIAVGAPGEDAGGSSAGAAYLFGRDAGGTNGWGEVKKLIASDAEMNDEFGLSIALNDDLLAVGAPGEDTGGSDAGAVYIFEQNTGGTNGWGEVKKLIASDAEENALFGSSVAVAGDLLVVGAPEGVAGGAAYIFQKNNGGYNAWGELKKLTSSDLEEYDCFGIAVAMSGDLILVGASHGDGGSITDPSSLHDHSGAAYLFKCDLGGTNAWGQLKKLIPSNVDGGCQFGKTVSIEGDRVLIGAEVESSAGDLAAGAAYIFERNWGGSNVWSEVKKLTATDDRALHDYFGVAVALAGNVAVVGAKGKSSSAGAAYIFEEFETPPGDDDDDGLLDSWEELYYGDTSPVSSDICSNGVNTLKEAYIAGFNPTNTASFFELSCLQNQLLWHAISGRVYAVYWTTNLLDGFQPLDTNIPWTAGGFTDTVNGVETEGFYKLQVEME